MDISHHQHRAADHQHGEGDQAEPIRPAAAGEVFSVVMACLLCNGISRPVPLAKTPIITVSYYISCSLEISIPNCNNFMNFPIFTSLSPVSYGKTVEAAEKMWYDEYNVGPGAEHRVGI